MLGDLLAEREVTMEFVSTIYDRYMDLVKTIIDKLDKSTLGLTEEACRNLAIATLAALANLLASRILYDGRKDSVDESKALQDLANAMDRLSDALSVVSSHPTLSPVFNDFVRNDIKKIIESSGIIIAIESDVSKVADLHRMLVDGSVSTIMLILLQAVQLTTQIILNPTKLASKIRDYPDYKFTFDVARAWQACVGRRPTASWSRITDKSSPIVYFAEYLQAIEPSIGTETIRAVISAFPDLQGFVIARCSVGFDRARVVVVLALLSASFHVKKKSAHAAEQERPDI